MNDVTWAQIVEDVHHMNESTLASTDDKHLFAPGVPGITVARITYQVFDFRNRASVLRRVFEIPLVPFELFDHGTDISRKKIKLRTEIILEQK